MYVCRVSDGDEMEMQSDQLLICHSIFFKYCDTFVVALCTFMGNLSHTLIYCGLKLCVSLLIDTLQLS